MRAISRHKVDSTLIVRATNKNTESSKLQPLLLVPATLLLEWGEKVTTNFLAYLYPILGLLETREFMILQVDLYLVIPVPNQNLQ